MTKRELCERLTSIRDELRDFRFAENGVEPLINSATNDLRDLILDIAAPETEEEKEEAFRERCRAVFGDLAEPEEETK